MTDFLELTSQLRALNSNMVSERELLRQVLFATNPFFGGKFHEDRLDADHTLIREMKHNLVIAELTSRPERGLVLYVNLLCYGIGGKNISGSVVLDTSRLEFEQITTMYQKGLTDPSMFGWYVSMWDTVNNRYGVTWRSPYPAPYERDFKVIINNNAPTTVAGTGDVTYDLHSSRFVKE